MADDQIPTEALEAAARALYNSSASYGGAQDWWADERMSTEVRAGFRYQAASILEAAAPHLIAEGRRQAAEAIRAVDVAKVEHLHGDSTRIGLTVAARIVEGTDG